MDRALHEALEKGSTFELESLMLHKEGHYLPVETRAVVSRDDEGKAVRLSGATGDLTERKRAEEERMKWEQRLQQVQKAESLSRMAGAIAHHFNNMLAAVMGNLELAETKIDRDSNARTNLINALKACHRAADVSRLMLTYIGQIAAKPELIDLLQTTTAELHRFRASLPQNVHLKVEFSSTGPIILADEAHIRQVAACLVQNASEAIGDVEGTVTVSIHVKDVGEIRGTRFFPLDWKPRAAGYACLQVADTGCGMDSAIIERLFDPFFSTKFTGRGLGLPVALGLVKAIEGAISVETTPGQGSTFQVFLPLPQRQIAQPSREEFPPVRPSEKRKLILLVDDEVLVRDSAREMLMQFGYEVVTAADGPEALEVFGIHKDDVDLVLLDMGLPGMDGWDTLTALRAIRRDIPVVLSSGYREAEVRREDCPEQPQAFLQKPYGVADLLAAVGAAMHIPFRTTIQEESPTP
jgi:signal transduction histidine kinase/CheY-like chemotaxis protein